MQKTEYQSVWGCLLFLQFLRLFLQFLHGFLHNFYNYKTV